jgi:hypothetical protein
MTALNNEIRRENIILQGLIISELGKSPLYLHFPYLAQNVCETLFEKYGVLIGDSKTLPTTASCLINSGLRAVLTSVMRLRERKLVRLQTSEGKEPPLLVPLNEVYVMLTDLGRADVEKVNEQLKKLEGMDLATAS